ncbi:MAG: putative toxin-antitoxin system toxin component, PIN family [Bacteroidales bacterium]|nr:putative toxin-antitoxin system toxin component, PIN family [Bacteroidales bacterium]
MRSKKVILDTNLWISFLISKSLDEIDNLIIDGKIKLIFSKESIEEFITVAKRPKFKNYFNDNDINNLLRLFDNYGKLIDVSVEITDCRDFKDNFLLSLAVESKSDYLVTGDTDLLIG